MDLLSGMDLLSVYLQGPGPLEVVRGAEANSQRSVKINLSQMGR